MMTTCPVCGTEFVKRRKNHKHCSSRCTLSLFRIRQKALDAFHNTLLSLHSKAAVTLLIDGMTPHKEDNS